MQMSLSMKKKEHPKEGFGMGSRMGELEPSIYSEKQQKGPGINGNGERLKATDGDLRPISIPMCTHPFRWAAWESCLFWISNASIYLIICLHSSFQNFQVTLFCDKQHHPMATENSPPIKHIADAMASSSPASSSSSSSSSSSPPPPAPKLSHALPSLPGSAPALPFRAPISPPPGLPLPTSEFTTYRPRIPWKPACTHIIMTRFYAKRTKCDRCNKPPQQGWLYRCVQDREALLRQQIEDGKQVAYDDVGITLLGQVKPAHRGPEERSDKHSFLRRELTAESMQQYSPDQISTILEQRENVNLVAQIQLRENRLKSCKVPMTKLAEILAKDNNRRPWSPRDSEECRLKVCHSCRSIYEPRSYLSINGIANGDVPVHAAVGWGFGFFKHRPVVSAELISKWGNRPVPLPRQGIPHASSIHLSSASSSHWSVMDIIEEHLRNSYHIDKDVEDNESEDPTTIEQGDQLFMKRYSRHLPTNPIRVSGNGAVGLLNSENDVPSSQELLIRPPWTPPPSPGLIAQEPREQEASAIGFAPDGSTCDGRSDASLKTNPVVRFNVFSSLLPPAFYLWEDGAQDSNPEHPSIYQHGHHILYEPEEAYDVGLTLPFNEEVYDRACDTALPESDNKGELFFSEDKTAMEEFEEDEGLFTAAPLDVPHGVAVTEEAVGFGVADVVTQV